MNISSLIPLTVLSILLGAYICMLLWLRSGLKYPAKPDAKERHTVSVIVAARNEEAVIDACLDALAAQDYPTSLHEIIFVNDRSDDNTAAVIKAFCDRFGHFKMIEITERHPEMAPKKWALESGIKASSGDIIVTTDADCAPLPAWVKGIAGYFNEDVGFVAGFSPLSRVSLPTIFSRLILLDGLALGGVARAGLSLGYPLTCTARNLAYRRKAFDEAGGFKSIGSFISGDDDLLMHQIRKRTKWKMVYAADPSTYVPSIPVRNLRDFFAQRTRHASKGRFYDPALKGALAGFYLMNLILFVCPLLPGPLIGYLFLLLLKIGTEWLFLFRTAAVLHHKKALKVFPLAALLHIPYVVIIGLWGQVGRFRWKGDRFGSQQKID